MQKKLILKTKNFDILKSLGVTEDTFAMEGWIPKSKIESVNAELQKHSNDTTALYELKTNENPPTLLNNPKKLRIFESFIRFYSLPSGKV